MNDFTPRDLSSFLGVLAFGLLIWRTVSTYREASWLMPPMIALMLSDLLITALGSYLIGHPAADTPPPPVNVAVYLLIGHRCLCIAFAFVWPWLLHRRPRPLPGADQTGRGR